MEAHREAIASVVHALRSAEALLRRPSTATQTLMRVVHQEMDTDRTIDRPRRVVADTETGMTIAVANVLVHLEATDVGGKVTLDRPVLADAVRTTSSHFQDEIPATCRMFRSSWSRT